MSHLCTFVLFCLVVLTFFHWKKHFDDLFHFCCIVNFEQQVAARVKVPGDEEQWILAEVSSYNQTTGKYDVDDIDYTEEDGKTGNEYAYNWFIEKSIIEIGQFVI